LACSTYPQCRYTANLDEGGEIKSAEVKSELKCKKCNSPLLIKTGRFGRFLACSRYPDCKFTQGMGVGIKCPQDNCGGDIVEKRSKKGRLFFACSHFPACKFVSWYKPVLKPCPLCGAAYLVEKKAQGEKIVIACAKEGCTYKEEE
jgi:DNA topoisomerase-1